MKLGLVQSGAFTGKKIILEPRENMPQNEYWVEVGTFFNGSPEFRRHCLACEQEVSEDGCQGCQ